MLKFSWMLWFLKFENICTLLAACEVWIASYVDRFSKRVFERSKFTWSQKLKKVLNPLMLGLFELFLKSCPEGAKKNHQVCLRPPDCKFWMGPEDPFRSCQPCLCSPWQIFSTISEKDIKSSLFLYFSFNSVFGHNIIIRTKFTLDEVKGKQVHHKNVPGI